MPETMPTHKLPDIPGKRYFTIGEVSRLCGVKTHVLRYWEQEFTQLRPVKRRGNRRYYQREDVLLIRHIRALLYEQGYTIGGARQQLEATAPGGAASCPSLYSLRDIIGELEDIARTLAAAPGGR